MDGWSGGLVGVSFTWLVVFFVGDLQVDWILCPVFFSNLTFRFGRRDSQNLPVAYGLGLRWTDTSKPLWIMRATWCHLACCGDVEHGKPRWTFTSGFHVVQDQFEMDSLSLVELPIFRWGSFSCTVFFFQKYFGLMSFDVTFAGWDLYFAYTSVWSVIKQHGKGMAVKSWGNHTDDRNEKEWILTGLPKKNRDL